MTILTNSIQLSNDRSRPYKFVRDGEVIAVDNINVSHDEIAKHDGVGSVTKREWMDEVLVDDAGAISFLAEGRILVFGLSSSCEYRDHDLGKVRKETGEIVKKILGENFTVEAGN